MSNTTNHPENPGVPPYDELDALLRLWHEENADRAAVSRARLVAQLASDRPLVLTAPARDSSNEPGGAWTRLAAGARSRTLRAAASLALLITAIALLIPLTSQQAVARQEIILVPEGGRLQAVDERGQVLGPCALKHTDVHADIAGPFSRVTVKQQYHNPYQNKIEALYTFPLSHRASVDRMTMTIRAGGEERIIEGEVKERAQARQMYESARDAGQVASLLEQERPNIFTQSVANIEPGAQVLIEVSYVEMLQQREGEFTFDFPMVVAPRYIPGSPTGSLAKSQTPALVLPNELERREGLILLGPAGFERMKIGIEGDADRGAMLFNNDPQGPLPIIQKFIDAAVPILPPEPPYRARADVQELYRANPNYDFSVKYADGQIEFGQIAGDGLGHINGRWFYFDPAVLSIVQREEASHAAAFAANTNQVPDASRITPMPVPPTMRAGHDISVSVCINTGTGAGAAAGGGGGGVGGTGPAIVDWKSDLHEVICTDPPTYHDLGNKVNLALKNQREIPNRDFVLRWRCQDDAIREAVFTHADAKWVDHSPVPITKAEGPALIETPSGAPPQMRWQPALTMDMPRGGGFFTAVIAPPAKVAPEQALPRELIFVLDTSGSMQGLPIEKAKAVMAKAIDAMRPGDTFNLITFSGDTRILWRQPRANSEANRAEAQAFLAGQSGDGGTEMMTAIHAALKQTPADATRQANALTPAQLADLPADGRDIIVRTRLDDIEAIVMKNAVMQPVLRVRPDLALKTTSFQLPVEQMRGNPLIELRGKWSTINGERTLGVATAARVEEGKDGGTDPLRIVMFLTDGQVGNDDAIIAAVRENSKTTRVFSFGIGDSPNRHLLDGIAQAGRGEAAYVNLQNDPDAAVLAFARRIESPVLRDIQVTFSEGLEAFDLMPALDSIPDLWDVKPLIIHGRYSSAKPQSGKITITGKTATGDYARVIDVMLPANEPGNAMLPALWARAKIDDVLARDESIRRQGIVEYATDESKKQIIALGERYGITSAFTSFVAIEKARMTVAGRPMLVPVPIEFPSGMKWEGVFGGDANHRPADDVTRAMLGEIQNVDHDRAVRLIQIDQKRRDVNATPVVVEQLRGMIATELGQAASAVDAPALRAGMDIAEAPALDLDGVLLQNASELSSDYFGIAASPSVQIDTQKSFAYQTESLYRFAPDELSLGLAPVAGGRSPATGGLWNVTPQPSHGFVDPTVRYGQTPIMGRLYVVGGDAGGFGGGGGGNGVGTGGSIFGEAGDDPQRVVTPEETQARLLDIVKETIHPDSWSDFGGDLVEATVENGVMNFRTLKDTPEAAQTVDRARGFLSMLAVAIPEVTEMAKADAPPTKPFDPVKDIGQPRDDVPADVPEDEMPPPMTLIIYDVRDLIAAVEQAGETDAVDRLINVITNLVAPDYWDIHGGEWGRVQTLKGNLIITIGPEQHRQIENLLTKIRAALAARNPEAQPVEAPVFKGLGAVDEPVAVPAARPASDADIEIFDVHEAIAVRMAAAQPLTRSDAIRTVINTIQEDIGPEGWRDAGGDTGSVHELANLLVIRTSAKNLDAIRGLLRESQDAKPQAVPDDQVQEQARREADAKAQAALTALQREDRLRRVLDDRLRARINGMNSKIVAKLLDESDRAVIAILVDDPDDAAMLARLRELGVRIDDRNVGLRLLAGEIDDVRNLVEVALMDSVRRIEPLDVRN